MVTSSTIYDLYVMNESKTMSELLVEIETLRAITTKITKWFEDTEYKRPLGVDEDKLLSGFHPLLEGTDKETKYFNIQLKTYNTNINPLREYISYRELHKGDLINQRIFTFILKRFNKLLMEALVTKGYEFYSKGLGTIKVDFKKNKKNIVNWGISLRNKNAIIERGEIPYLKEDAMKAEREGVEYKGVQWLVYLNDYSLFYDWRYTPSDKFRQPNVLDYWVYPLRGINSPVTYLQNHFKGFTYAQLLEKFNVKPETT